MNLDQKVVDDICPNLLNVLQGYHDHMGRCSGLVNAGDNNVIEDGNTPAVSFENHVRYSQQLGALLTEMGVNSPLVTAPIAQPEVAPVQAAAVEAVAEPVVTDGSVDSVAV